MIAQIIFHRHKPYYNNGLTLILLTDNSSKRETNTERGKEKKKEKTLYIMTEEMNWNGDFLRESIMCEAFAGIFALGGGEREGSVKLKADCFEVSLSNERHHHHHHNHHPTSFREARLFSGVSNALVFFFPSPFHRLNVRFVRFSSFLPFFFLRGGPDEWLVISAFARRNRVIQKIDTTWLDCKLMGEEIPTRRGLLDFSIGTYRLLMMACRRSRYYQTSWTWATKVW